jgi:Clp amino terminal domain, pathogenicity island component
MFERYTEKARRVVFFARYEATQYGSREIETAHLLLGLIREAKFISRWVAKVDTEAIRRRIESLTPKLQPISTSVDLPLSTASQEVLSQAALEADRLNHKYIAIDHLFLALVQEQSTSVGKLLRECGADPSAVRETLAKSVEQFWTAFAREPRPAGRSPMVLPETIEIHGSARNTEYVRDIVSTIRSYNWHWHKSAWKPRDIVIHRKNGTVSLDLSLAENAANFALVKQGWKKDHCFVCRWELFEADDEHGTGYTNGRNWLCMECCERFVLGDFFSSSQSDMT